MDTIKLSSEAKKARGVWCSASRLAPQATSLLSLFLQPIPLFTNHKVPPGEADNDRRGEANSEVYAGWGVAMIGRPYVEKPVDITRDTIFLVLCLLSGLFVFVMAA